MWGVNVDYYQEMLQKINDTATLKQENEELKRKLAEQKQTVVLESSVVQAFRVSAEYMQLESQAFDNFFKEKFIDEFQKSKHGQQLVTAAREQFKIFEENYNKEEKANGSSDKGFKKEVSRPNNK